MRCWTLSRPARGAWIETLEHYNQNPTSMSRPARGAWIETRGSRVWLNYDNVAPRTGRVD